MDAFINKHKQEKECIKRVDCEGVGDNDGYFECTVKREKECPFCGEEDDLLLTVDEVLCGNCSCHVGSMHKTKDINAEIWNTRAEQTEIRKLTKLLDKQYGTPCEQIRHQAEIDALIHTAVQVVEYVDKQIGGTDLDYISIHIATMFDYYKYRSKQ